MFVWFEAADPADVAFLAVNPFVYFPTYDVPLNDAEEAALEVEPGDELVVYCFVTIDRRTQDSDCQLVGTDRRQRFQGHRCTGDPRSRLGSSSAIAGASDRGSRRMSFQVSGLASGLDTAALVDGLMFAERATVRRLQSSQADETNALNAWTDIEAKLGQLNECSPCHHE